MSRRKISRQKLHSTLACNIFKDLYRCGPRLVTSFIYICMYDSIYRTKHTQYNIYNLYTVYICIRIKRHRIYVVYKCITMYCDRRLYIAYLSIFIFIIFCFTYPSHNIHDDAHVILVKYFPYIPYKCNFARNHTHRRKQQRDWYFEQSWRKCYVKVEK